MFEHYNEVDPVRPASPNHTHLWPGENGYARESAGADSNDEDEDEDEDDGAPRGRGLDKLPSTTPSKRKLSGAPKESSTAKKVRVTSSGFGSLNLDQTPTKRPRKKLETVIKRGKQTSKDAPVYKIKYPTIIITSVEMLT